MKRIDITAYGAPEEVGHCVDVPDVGDPGPGEIVFDFRSTRPTSRSAAAATGCGRRSRQLRAPKASDASPRSALGSRSSSPATW